MSKPSLTTKTVFYRKIKSFDVDSVNADLAESDLCRNPPDDLDELVACYDSTLRAVMDKHAPVQTRTIVVRPRFPWSTDDIRQAKKEKRKGERKWRSSKLELDLAVFKRERNAVNNLLNKAQREFYTNFMEENSGDQRRLFRASTRLLNMSRDDGLPPNLHATTFVNDLGQYFVTKIETIKRKLDIESFDSVTSSFDSVPDDSPSVSVPLFTDFENLSASDVASLIRRSALKSCPLDPMPSRLVSNCDALRPVIATIINKSLQTGHFPEGWKEALVYPLLKRPGLDAVNKNFRPVSNLAFVSKLTEKAAFDGTYSHMSANG